VKRRAIILIVAGVLVYANALRAPFILDDVDAIERNLTLRSLSSALIPPRETPVDSRPLVNLSFAANYANGGLDPAGYRVVNLGLHLLCGLLLFAIVSFAANTSRQSRGVRPVPQRSGGGGPSQL